MDDGKGLMNVADRLMNGAVGSHGVTPSAGSCATPHGE